MSEPMRRFNCADPVGWHPCLPAFNSEGEYVLHSDALRYAAEERDEELRWLINEINCRIEHGADSNGQLEGLQALLRVRLYGPTKPEEPKGDAP